MNEQPMNNEVNERNERLVELAPGMANILAGLLELHDAGVRPQVTRGMLAEEEEWKILMRQAREVLARAGVEVSQ